MARLLMLLASICAASRFTGESCAQHISFTMPRDGRYEYVPADDFEKHKADIEAADFEGSAAWLVSQQDPQARLHTLPKLKELVLVHHKTSLAEFQYISRLDTLESLTIGIAPEGVDIEPDSLQQLSHLKQLKSLNLSIKHLKERDLEVLASLDRLVHLGIDMPDEYYDIPSWERDRLDLSDAAADFIVSAKSLRTVKISPSSKITDQFVASLAALLELEHLELGSPTLTDETLRLAATQMNLRSLEVGSQKFTNKGVEWLRHAPRLEKLRLGSPLLTEEVVQTIKHLPLRHLQLSLAASQFFCKSP